MSEFVLIIPEGWTQLDWEFISNNVANMTSQNVNGGLLSDVEQWLKDGGQIPVESSLVEFKLIDNTYFMVKLG